MNEKFKSSYALFVVGAVVAVLLASPALAVDPIVGEWTGTVHQSGSGSYGVVMTLSSASGGSTEYASLNCGGSLSGGGSGGVYNFTETITNGRATEKSGGCIDGNIKAVLQGNWMFWEWTGSYRGKSYYVSGKLARSGPAPTTRTCDECGKALMNDLSFGLRQSAGFRNYAHEAWQKYGNCVRDIPGTCQNACESFMLYKNIPTCDRFNDAGYKACVKSMLEATQRKCR